MPLDDLTAIPDCKGLLNRKEVRLTALKLANERFPSQSGQLFNRVSAHFIDKLELAVQALLVGAINQHPSPYQSPTVKEFPWIQKTTQT